MGPLMSRGLKLQLVICCIQSEWRNVIGNFALLYSLDWTHAGFFLSICFVTVLLSFVHI